MSATVGSEPHGGTPPLPAAIWVVAWASLAGQVPLLIDRGVELGNGLGVIVSSTFGALIVGYVSAGVVRARTLRLALVWVLLVLAVVFQALSLAATDSATDSAVAALALGCTATSLGGLAMFRRTEWYAWQRTRPARDQGASIVGLVSIAVLVGILGGLVSPTEDVRGSGPSINLN